MRVCKGSPASLVGGLLCSLSAASLSAAALDLYDPFPNEVDSKVAFYSGNLRYPSLWNWAGDSLGTYIADSAIPASSYTYGVDYSNSAEPNGPTAVRGVSTFDPVGGFFSAELSYSGKRWVNQTESVQVRGFTTQLPTGVVLQGSGPNYDAYAVVGVFAKTADGLPVPGNDVWDNLGSILIDNQNGAFTWQVRRATWLGPGWLQFDTLASGTGDFDFSQIGQYVTQIVNGRTADYYYSGTAAVVSQTGFWSSGSVGPTVSGMARLGYVPEPTTVALLGGALLLVAGRRRRVHG